MSNNSANAPKTSILIVDDTPDNLFLLSTILAEKRYIVRSALSGQIALREVQIDPPDLILLDITMPYMNGYEVCQHLKASPETSEIPVIFISALDEVWDKVKAFEVGGVDYIARPFHVEEVWARIENQLTIRQLQKQLQERNTRLQQEITDRERIESDLQKANQELKSLAILDGLTQIANRRRFDEYLYQEWCRMGREQETLSLIMCDVDYFQNYNNTYGHQAGDRCLQKVAQALERSIKRPADLAARYGGEEFAIILPHTNDEGAVQVAESVQAELQKFKIPHINSAVSSYVTISIGVCSTIPNHELTPDRLIAVTDEALYAAKRQGKNRIIVKAFEPLNLAQNQEINT